MYSLIRGHYWWFLLAFLAVFLTYADYTGKTAHELIFYAMTIVVITIGLLFERKNPAVLCTAVFLLLLMSRALLFLLHYSGCIAWTLSYQDPALKNRVFTTSCRTIFPSAPVMKTINQPCIYMANHAYKCCMDIPTLASILPEKSRLIAYTNTVPMLKDSVQVEDATPSVVYISGSSTGNYQRTRDLVMDLINRGYSIVVFPERAREKTSDEDIAELRSGMFSIAQELQIPVVPLYIRWPTRFPMFLHGVSVPETWLGTPMKVDSVEEAKKRVWEFLSSSPYSSFQTIGLSASCE